MSSANAAASPASGNGAHPPDVEQAAMAMAVAAAAAATNSTTAEHSEDADYDEVPSADDKRAKRGFSKRVTLRDLERYFEYPIEEVSKMMGVSTTIIKRLCRKYGIKRWPYRQIRSVNKSIKYVELLARTAAGSDRQRLQDQLVSLHYKKQLICQAATTGASAKVRKSILQMRPEELDAETLLRTGPGDSGADIARPRATGSGVASGGHGMPPGSVPPMGIPTGPGGAHGNGGILQGAGANISPSGGGQDGGEDDRDRVNGGHHDPHSAENAAAAAAAAALASAQGAYGMPPHMSMAGMAMGYSPYVHMAAAAQAQHQAMAQQQGEPGPGGGMQGGGAPMHPYGHIGMYTGYPSIMGMPYAFQSHGYPSMPGYGVPGMGGYPSLAGGPGDHMAPPMGMSGMAAMQLAAQTMQQHEQHPQHPPHPQHPQHSQHPQHPQHHEQHSHLHYHHQHRQHQDLQHDQHQREGGAAAAAAASGSACSGASAPPGASGNRNNDRRHGGNIENGNTDRGSDRPARDENRSGEQGRIGSSVGSSSSTSRPGDGR